jgi:hypothetical protein
MCCNPANGIVNFEEWSAYKNQLHGIVSRLRPKSNNKKKLNIKIKIVKTPIQGKSIFVVFFLDTYIMFSRY